MTVDQQRTDERLSELTKQLADYIDYSLSSCRAEPVTCSRSHFPFPPRKLFSAEQHQWGPPLHPPVVPPPPIPPLCRQSPAQAVRVDRNWQRKLVESVVVCVCASNLFLAHTEIRNWILVQSRAVHAQSEFLIKHGRGADGRTVGGDQNCDVVVVVEASIRSSGANDYDMEMW